MRFKLLIIKKCLDKTEVNLEVVEGVEGAEILHADDLAANVPGELEVNSHFAALWKRAVLA